MAGTKEDAQLIVQIAQWGSTMGTDDAAAALFAPGFDPAAATTEDRNVRRILTLGETIGTLVENGLLNRELVLDWLWVAGIWERVAPAVQKDRDRFGEPRLYENFEALAAG